MKKKIFLKLFSIALVFAMLGSDVLAQSRISFRRGRSSATVGGPIGAKGYREYLIRGRAGQVMTIKISSGNGAVTANAGSASGKDFSVEMTGGDHLITVYNSGGATRYTMTVMIR